METDLIKTITRKLEDLSNGTVLRDSNPIEIPENTSDEIRALCRSVNNLSKMHSETLEYIKEFGKGNLNSMAPRNNHFVEPFMELQSNLQNLVWHTQRLAKGDYTEKIDFLGNFSKPFNRLINSLREKQVIEQKLEKSYEQLSRHSKELEDLNLIKDQFFAIIAHELRGPVGSIDAFLEQIIFYFDKIEKENLLPDIKLIKETSQSTFELLERLLVWAKAQKNEISYNPKLHNLSRLVDSNISLFSIAINDKELTVSNKISEEVIAFFDYDMIKTVVRNLISNAIKFSNIGGKIEVSATEKGDNMLEIKICDNGIGMDKQTYENLFRLDIKHKSNIGTKGEKGTGMGLILTKEFINRHGGNIWYISEPGKGSCATFTIPCNNVNLL